MGNLTQQHQPERRAASMWCQVYFCLLTNKSPLFFPHLVFFFEESVSFLPAVLKNASAPLCLIFFFFFLNWEKRLPEACWDGEITTGFIFLFGLSLLSWFLLVRVGMYNKCKGLTGHSDSSSLKCPTFLRLDGEQSDRLPLFLFFLLSCCSISGQVCSFFSCLRQWL